MTTPNNNDDALRLIPQILEQLASFRAEFEQFRSETIEHQAENTKFQAETLKYQAENTKFQTDTIEYQTENTKFQADTIKFQTETIRRLNRIQDDVGLLKGNDATIATAQHAADIAGDMGLELVGTLGRNDLRTLSADASDLADNVLESFRRADLVIEAKDREETCYIAVEASYTVDEYDVERAARNARLLTRFTGSPGHAAVAGVYRHGSADAGLASGKAHWYALFESTLHLE